MRIDANVKRERKGSGGEGGGGGGYHQQSFPGGRGMGISGTTHSTFECPLLEGYNCSIVYV